MADEHAQANIFSAQQEEWLGEAMADRVESEYRLVSDASLNAHLQMIVDKLAMHLPPTQIKFRVVLVDSADINGFSLAGGRIYLTRKLAALAQNDDELAAVLGHEMGHIASHQFTFEATRDLKRLLNITSVGDRADVYAKFQALMDAEMRDKHPQPSGDDDTGQDEADKIGVYAAAAAGYRPQAEADFWNRVFFVGGKTGNKISDFFRLTKPNEKRLRGMQALIVALPKGCGAEKSEVTTEFAMWHRAVVADQAVVAAATSPSMKEVVLTPPLHMDLDRLRFSPDGKTILAQDQSSIFVIAGDTLKVEFRMDARRAFPAQFSPDSQRVVFTTEGLHTEEWSITDKSLKTAQEVVAKETCLQSQLSPDGKTLVCITLDPEFWQTNLYLLDVATGAVVWQKKPFFEPTGWIVSLMLTAYEEGEGREVLPVKFSADGNVVMTGLANEKIAIDLRTRTVIKLPWSLIDTVSGGYAFVGSNRIAGVSLEDHKKSGLYSFPEGQLLKSMGLPQGWLTSVSASDNYAIISGIPDYEAGLINFSTGQINGLRSQAVDVWNSNLIGQIGDGSITLMNLSDPKAQQKRMDLPLSPLADSQSMSMSPEGKYLAISTRYHGGIWDLGAGKQVLATKGFQSVHWGKESELFVDIPKQGSNPRQIMQIELSPVKGTPVTYKVDDNIRIRFGGLYEWKTNGKKAADLIRHNPADNAVLWTKNFSDGRGSYTASVGWGDLIFNYQMNSGMAKEFLKSNPNLAAQLAALKHKELARMIEVVDASNGKTLSEMVLELPLNFSGTNGLNRMGNLLFVDGADNRTMVYSFETGKQLRQLFGHVVAVDGEAKRVCTVNREDETVVYDEQGNETAHFHMGSPLRFARFTEHGTQLMLLTADQKMRTMDLTKPMVAEAR